MGSSELMSSRLLSVVFPVPPSASYHNKKQRTYIEQLALNLSKMKKLFLKEKSTFFRDRLPDLSKSYLSLLVITKISLLSLLVSTCVSSPPLWKTDNYHISKMFFKVCCNMVFTTVTLVWKFWLGISTVLCCPNKSYIKTSLNISSDILTGEVTIKIVDYFISKLISLKTNVTFM